MKRNVSKKAGYYCAVAAFAMVLLVSLFVGPSVSLAQDAETNQDVGSRQWLVLKNGQTLPGQITLIDHRYEVVADSGSRILIPETEAHFVADSMEDIYWDRWASVSPDDGPGQVDLFHWCLRNGLIKEAQNQILRVADMPEFEQQSQELSRMSYEMELAVDRQIKKAETKRRLAIEKLNIRPLPSLEADSSQAFAQASSLNPPPMIPSLASNNRSMTRLAGKAHPIDAEGNPLPTRREPGEKETEIGGIGLASFEEETLEPVARRENAAYVNNAQLDRESRKMPRGAFQFFRKHIEPGLMQNCIQCHDSMAGSMPLTQRSFGNTMPRRMSQQNMHFVMKWIDKSNPLDSRMLQMARTAHGKQSESAFDPHDEFAINLQKWSIAICDDPARWLIEFTQQRGSHSVAPIDAAPVWPRESASEKPESISPMEVEATPVPKPKNDSSEIAPSRSGSEDPYDPAAFNKSDK